MVQAYDPGVWFGEAYNFPRNDGKEREPSRA